MSAGQEGSDGLDGPDPVQIRMGEHGPRPGSLRSVPDIARSEGKMATPVKRCSLGSKSYGSRSGAFLGRALLSVIRMASAYTHGEFAEVTKRDETWPLISGFALRG